MSIVYIKTCGFLKLWEGWKLKKIKTYENSDTKKLNKKYDIKECDRIILNSMVDDQDIKVVNIFLSLIMKKGKIVGIKKTDLEFLAKRKNCFLYEWAKMNIIDELIKTNYFKLKIDHRCWEKILFPTEKLLKSQKIPLKSS